MRTTSFILKGCVVCGHERDTWDTGTVLLSQSLLVLLFHLH